MVSVLKELGCLTYDADKIAHSVMEPGKSAYADIVRQFGEGILREDKTIDRVRLGAIVFADATLRQRLNEIVHPRVIEQQNARLAEAEAANPYGIAVMDAALMIESGGYKRFDKLIVVFCDKETQIERLMARNQITREDAERRIAAQMSSDEKRRYADYEIDTTGTMQETRERVKQMHDKLLQLQKTVS